MNKQLFLWQWIFKHALSNNHLSLNRVMCREICDFWEVKTTWCKEQTVLNPERTTCKYDIKARETPTNANNSTIYDANRKLAVRWSVCQVQLKLVYKQVTKMRWQRGSNSLSFLLWLSSRSILFLNKHLNHTHIQMNASGVQMFVGVVVCLLNNPKVVEWAKQIKVKYSNARRVKTQRIIFKTCTSITESHLWRL